MAGALVKTQIAGPPSSFWFRGSGKAQDLMLKLGLLVEIIENNLPSAQETWETLKAFPDPQEMQFGIRSLHL